MAGTAASTVGGIIAIQHLQPVIATLPWPVLRQTAEPLAALVVVALVSYLSLIIGELVPKAIGLQYADRIALRLARPMQITARLTAPVVAVLTCFNQNRPGLLGSSKVSRMPLSPAKRCSISWPRDTKAVSSARLNTNISATSLNLPTPASVKSWCHAPGWWRWSWRSPRAEILQVLLETQYSRYPVYRDSIEDIIGVVHTKDLLGKLVRGEPVPLAEVLRPPVFVPEGKKVNDLLKEMQRTRNHMALVVDEYGGLAGLVTTEDLLEELVGEIEDEHDAGEPELLQQLDDGSWLADGMLPVFDLKELLAIKLEDDLPYDTLAGLILHELGHLPDQGES